MLLTVETCLLFRTEIPKKLTRTSAYIDTWIGRSKI